jgi:pimeloyl-ACP methyl ester carboxylesterase
MWAMWAMWTQSATRERQRPLGSCAATPSITAGRTRPLFAAVFDAACRLMPHVEAHKVADAGHSVYREQPEAFNRLALEFLERRTFGLIRSSPALPSGRLPKAREASGLRRT